MGPNILTSRLTGTLASSHLDLVRGLAAITVLVSHLRNLFFVDYSQLAVGEKGLLAATLYFATDLGHQAVIIFFVLSGFLIGRSVLEAVNVESWGWPRYLISRCTRLYVVLIPALILGYGLDSMGIAFSRGQGIYSNRFSNQVITFCITHRLHWWNVIGSALFLQDILVKPVGSNVALWSLSCEFWFYIIFPVLVFALVPGRLRLRWPFCCSAVVLLLFVGKAVACYFLIWLMGALINYLPGLRSRNGAAYIGSAGFVFCLALLVSRIPAFVSAGFVNDLMLGGATSILIWALLCDQRPQIVDSGYFRLTDQLAKISYTLYLVHLPFLVLLCSEIEDTHRWQPSVRSVSGGVLVACLALLYAGCVAFCFESRTQSVRIYVTSLVDAVTQPLSATKAATADDIEAVS